MSIRHLLCTLMAFTTCSAIGLLEIRIHTPRALNATVCVYPFGQTGKDPIAVSMAAGNTTTLEYTTVGNEWQGFVNLTIDILKDNGASDYSVFWTGEAISGDKWNDVIPEPLEASYRFTCRENHYGPGCLTYCEPTDHAVAGHFRCTDDGKRVCLPGWKGERCDEALCASSCGNGTCVAPDTCECNSGWRGEKCDECDPGKKCKHGMCRDGVPGTCACLDEYSGPNCDIDRHFCTRYSPCKNGATCLNGKRALGHDLLERNRRAIEYTCVCANGWTGKQCEKSTVNHICGESAQPCLNGGRCVPASNGTRCECANGFSGNYCQTDDKGSLRSPAKTGRRPLSCKINECQNGATCFEQNGIPTCQCSACFTGPRCEVNVCPVTSLPSTTVVPAPENIEGSIITAQLLGGVAIVVIVVGILYASGNSANMCRCVRLFKADVRQNDYNEGLSNRTSTSGSGTNTAYKICLDGSVLTDALPPPYTPRMEDLTSERKQDSRTKDQKIYSKCDRTPDTKDPTAV